MWAALVGQRVKAAAVHFPTTQRQSGSTCAFPTVGTRFSRRARSPSPLRRLLFFPAPSSSSFRLRLYSSSSSSTSVGEEGREWKWASWSSQKLDLEEAVAECARKIKEQLRSHSRNAEASEQPSNVDLCFVWSSHADKRKKQRLPSLVRNALGARVLLGSSSAGVLSSRIDTLSPERVDETQTNAKPTSSSRRQNNKQKENKTSKSVERSSQPLHSTYEPTLSVTAVKLPPNVELHPFHVTTPSLPNLAIDWESYVCPPSLSSSSSSSSIDKSTQHEEAKKSLLFLLSFCNFPQRELLRRLDFALPRCLKVGGVVDASYHDFDNGLFLNDEVYTHGAVGLLMTGSFECSLVQAQSLRPLGSQKSATWADYYTLVAINDRDPILEMQRVAEELQTEEEKKDFLRGTYAAVGIMVDNDDEMGRKLQIRRIQKIDHEARRIIVEEGDEDDEEDDEIYTPLFDDSDPPIQFFFVKDKERAIMDLQNQLLQLKENILDKPQTGTKSSATPFGALAFSSSARNLYLRNNNQKEEEKNQAKDKGRSRVRVAVAGDDELFYPVAERTIVESLHDIDESDPEHELSYHAPDPDELESDDNERNKHVVIGVPPEDMTQQFGESDYDEEDDDSDEEDEDDEEDDDITAEEVHQQDEELRDVVRDLVVEVKSVIEESGLDYTEVINEVMLRAKRDAEALRKSLLDEEDELASLVEPEARGEEDKEELEEEDAPKPVDPNEAWQLYSTNEELTEKHERKLSKQLQQLAPMLLLELMERQNRRATPSSSSHRLFAPNKHYRESFRRNGRLPRSPDVAVFEAIFGGRCSLSGCSTFHEIGARRERKRRTAISSSSSRARSSNRTTTTDEGEEGAAEERKHALASHTTSFLFIYPPPKKNGLPQ
ncbi:NPL domain-containing protein [Balamuthia mandrillaris]